MKRFYVSLTVLWLSLTVGAQSVSDARWLTLPSASTTKVTHYSLDWDFAIQRLNAGFLFSGNAAHNTFYMWQINLETGKALLRPHICIGGTFTLLTEVDISSLVSLRQDENETHHLHLDIDGNVVTTTIDHVVVSTFQVPYDEVSYGEFGIRQYGNEAAYFDNMLVQDLSSPDAPRTLISENFETYAALEGGLIVTQPDGNGRIGIAGTTNWYVPAQNGIPVFRKTFTLPGGVRRAVLQASALGVYNTFVNGTRVGDQELTPGWTDYRKEVAYQEYDVTPMLLPGDNCLAAEVSGGWWGGDIAHGAYGSHPGAQFVASLHIDLADGTSMVIPTDDTWLSAQCGRVVAADIYDGETYDARRPDDWKTAAYDASSWTRATVAQGAHPTLFRQTSPQVRVRATLERQPEKVTVYQGSRATGTTYGMINIVSEAPELSDITLRKGQTMLVDLGQNMVGWAEFTVQGAAGTKMTVRHGEMLNYNGDANRLDKGPGGSLWTYNLRTADATVNYILSGDSAGETYHPSHTFMGFRYIELTADNDIVVRRVAGKVVGSDITEWGRFACSDQDINRLYQNIWWGQRGNFLSIPTDCPQRDERLGWTGDTQIFARTALYNSDAKELYRQWMRDMRNGQSANGAFRDIIPYCLFWGEGNAAWGDAGVIVPWTVFDMTGDRTMLEENYDAMKRWMDFCASKADGTYQYNGAGTSFGDWLAYESIDARYVSVCYYAYSALLMQKAALALSANAMDAYAQDAKAYARLYEAIKAEFNLRYADAATGIKNATQTSYLLALFLRLVDGTARQACIDGLRAKIENNGCKLSTGFVGTGILCTTLSDTGMDDLAYALLQQRKNPSWLYSVDQGATTIWERWDSYTVEGGFNKHPWNMNSFNHYSYGAVAEWLYAGIAGIQTPAYAPTSTAEGGWKHLVLCPHPDTRTEAQIEAVGGERMMWAEAETRMPQGTVAARWTRKPDGRITYVVTIPKGVVATVKMPRLTPEDQVTVDGTAVGNGQPDGSRLSFELAGGTYTVDCLAPTSTAVGMPVTTGNDASKETYYNLAGQKQSRPAKGINLSSRRYAFIQN
jgi:alpha-L-rhamnosidase